MKLTNQQIDALAQKFCNDYLQENLKVSKKQEQKIKQSFKPFYDKGVKILEANSNILNSITLKMFTITSELKLSMTFESFTKNWSIKSYIESKLKTKKLDKSEIRQDIILATIDNSSIEEIMKTLTKKYK